jgi:hypothetical protein
MDWVSIANFIGATGSDGPTGSVGVDGSIAGMGPTGEVGYTGPRGPDGPDNDFSDDKGLWLSNFRYVKDNYVIDPIDNNFYVCKDEVYNSSIPPSSSYASSTSILSDKSIQFPLRNPSNMVANTQRILSNNSYNISNSTFDNEDTHQFSRSHRGSR